MRRINIRNSNKIITKSFYSKDDFKSWLRKHIKVCLHYFLDQVADEVWDLNMGKSISYYETTFSIQSKRRSGNVLMNG